MSQDIVMYTATGCADCEKLKKYMDSKGVSYTTRDIRENPEYAKELEEKTGKEGVPYLVIDGEWKRGYQPGEPFSTDFADELLGLN